MIIGPVLELIVFSLPSLIYMRRLQHRGTTSSDARAAVAWRVGAAETYRLAVAVALVLLPLTYLAIRAIPTGALGTQSNLHVTYGRATTAAGYVAIVLLAITEEILFRGLIAGVLIRRYGFAAGNILQALVFFAPHLLLLTVSTAIWPLLPVQLVAGWLLGLLRHKSGSIGPSSLAHVAANLLAPLLLTI
ncbi:MAG: CPBP family intramembrane metalloprotease [Actinomycetota bacterium]|nr:CPBP family intramembrane metalloprotease [Actinomycetota bacterium]